MKFFFGLAALGAVVAFFSLIGALTQDSAPRQAAAGVIAIGWAVVPYVFARAIEKMGGPREVHIVDNLRYVEVPAKRRRGGDSDRDDQGEPDDPARKEPTFRGPTPSG